MFDDSRIVALTPYDLSRYYCLGRWHLAHANGTYMSDPCSCPAGGEHPLAEPCITVDDTWAVVPRRFAGRFFFYVEASAQLMRNHSCQGLTLLCLVTSLAHTAPNAAKYMLGST